MGLIGQFCVHENAWNPEKRALVAGEVSLKRTRAVCEAVHLTKSECFHSFWTFVPQGKVFEASPVRFPTGRGRRPVSPASSPPATPAGAGGSVRAPGPATRQRRARPFPVCLKNTLLSFPADGPCSNPSG